VLAYLVGPMLDGPLRAVLGGRALVATSESACSPSDIPAACAMAGVPESDGIYLVGYSRGCQAIRTQLMRDVDPIGVVTIDGTHASLPPEQWQIDVWRRLAQRARCGKRQWVATCTQMSYVEQLPPGEPGRALSTRHLLERVLETQLPPGRELHDGSLHALSFPSRSIDQAAHARQLRDVLPMVLERFALPWLAPSDEIRRSGPAWREPNLSLGARCLAWSMAQLGVTEEPLGSDTGPKIRAWLAPCEHEGKPLALTAADWCAAFVCAGQAASLLEGEAPLHPYVAAGIELERHFQATGRWLSAADARTGRRLPGPGDVVVLSRGAPGGWERHVCRIATPIQSGRFTTVGGNEADGVRLTERRLADTSLRGFGVVDGEKFNLGVRKSGAERL